MGSTLGSPVLWVVLVLGLGWVPQTQKPREAFGFMDLALPLGSTECVWCGALKPLQSLPGGLGLGGF